MVGCYQFWLSRRTFPSFLQADGARPLQTLRSSSIFFTGVATLDAGVETVASPCGGNLISYHHHRQDSAEMAKEHFGEKGRVQGPIGFCCVRSWRLGAYSD
jgi:hypothetical protein